MKVLFAEKIYLLLWSPKTIVLFCECPKNGRMRVPALIKSPSEINYVVLLNANVILGKKTMKKWKNFMQIHFSYGNEGNKSSFFTFYFNAAVFLVHFFVFYVIQN